MLTMFIVNFILFKSDFHTQQSHIVHLVNVPQWKNSPILSHYFSEIKVKKSILVQPVRLRCQILVFASLTRCVIYTWLPWKWVKSPVYWQLGSRKSVNYLDKQLIINKNLENFAVKKACVCGSFEMLVYSSLVTKLHHNMESNLALKHFIDIEVEI